MTYLQYTRTRERERSPYTTEDPLYTRPLVRQNSKRQRVDLYSDDEYDDYPYSSRALQVVQPSKPSRSLTIRQPTQLEKYNVWSYSPSPRTRTYDSDDEEKRYKYTTTTHKRYTPRIVSRTYPSDDEDIDSREREFRLKVKASFGRPKSALSRSNSFANKAVAWSSDVFKRREKWEDVAWESKERRGHETRGFWDDDDREEKTVRFRKVKRTKTDEWRPLNNFRRI